MEEYQREFDKTLNCSKNREKFVGFRRIAANLALNPLPLKKVSAYIRSFLLLAGLLFMKLASGQGRVVINEYMPWTLNGCGPTAEFVELMNFGPGPINIGCYILTDGDYSVTIPPNTILYPGEFYVIAGEDIIAHPCANIDSTIHADLNWNTCGCTNAPIPATGDGFFTDGGNANEQVVLLDPSLNVVDAVVRDLPAEPSSLITTANMGCGSKNFDLDLMNVHYETLGMSTGRGNSFARRLDGDCGWVKDPQQSGNATNNTPGEISDVSYTLSIVQSMDCDSSHGSIDIYVNVGVWTGELFPMNYTIALDADNNGIYDFSDVYTYGVDSTPPSVAITGLPLGRYKIVVASVNGCFLKTFDVTILECFTALDVKLAYFKLLNEANGMRTFQWLIGETSGISSINLEKSLDGKSFQTAAAMNKLDYKGSRVFTQLVPADGYSWYRLRLTDASGKITYSAVIQASYKQLKLLRTGPNPARDVFSFQLQSPAPQSLSFDLYDSRGAAVKNIRYSLHKGLNSLQLSTEGLPAGIYQLISKSEQPISLRFVKH